MRSIIVILFSFAVSAATCHAANLPTVDDVNRSVTNNQLEKAKTQLDAVLKEQPNSYNALRYMVEVYNIQEQVEQTKDPKKLYYQDRLSQVVNQQRSDAIVNFLKFLSALFLIPIGWFGGKWVRNRTLQKKAFKEAELEFRLKLNELLVDTLDTNQAVQQQLTIATNAIEKSRLEECCEELQDILSVLTDNGVKVGEVNFKDIELSLNSINQYLKRTTYWGAHV